MQPATTLRFASGLLRVLIVLNFVCLVLFVVVGIGTFPLEELLTRGLRADGYADPQDLLWPIRTMMLVAVIMVWPAHVVLTKLLRIVRSVGTGTAFSLANAARLKTIAWALLALQVLDLGFGWLSYGFEASPGWSPSITAWLAILLLFVLAQVFEQGATMREELDATV